MTAPIHLSLNRLKRLAAAIGVGLVWVVPVILISVATAAIVAVTTGADPRASFTDAPAIPSEVDELVEWRDDAPGLLRSVEPETRGAVATAWIGALAAGSPSASATEVETWFSGPALLRARARAESPSLASGPAWSQHRVHVHFYSLDGRIMGLEIESRGEIHLDAIASEVVDRYDAVLVLQDGNWRLHAVTARERS